MEGKGAATNLALSKFAQCALLLLGSSLTLTVNTSSLSLYLSKALSGSLPLGLGGSALVQESHLLLVLESAFLLFELTLGRGELPVLSLKRPETVLGLLELLR